MSRAGVLTAAALLGACLGPAGAEDDAALTPGIVEIAEFTAGGPLDGASRGRLAELVETELARDPSARDRTEASLSRILPAIRRLPDEPRRAAARSAIVTEIYWGSRRKPDPVAELVVERAGVVAADPETRAVVRRADLEGVCRSAALGVRESGEAFDHAGCILKLLIFAENLASFDRPGREILAAGERRYATLDEYWRRLSPARRADVLAAAKAQAGSQDPLRLARALETAAMAAALDARLANHADAAAEALVNGAVASTIQGAARGF